MFAGSKPHDTTPHYEPQEQSPTALLHYSHDTTPGQVAASVHEVLRAIADVHQTAT
jgi:hypothetical protein